MKFNRPEELFNLYLNLINVHLEEILNGQQEVMYELRDFADKLHVHPTHLSNVIKEYSGKHPCFFYENRLLEVSKNLLENRDFTIAEVAKMLTFDPSNFTKWFKHFEGMTPSSFRSRLLTEVDTGTI